MEDNKVMGEGKGNTKDRKEPCNFRSNMAGLELSKLVSRSRCQVRFSIKPEPARVEGTYQKVNSIIAEF